MLNSSIRYQDDRLYCDAIPVQTIVEQVGTPLYLYSLRRAIENYHQIRDAFAGLGGHVHYSAKANANLSLLRALVSAGAGIDCVSGGEIYKALLAGCAPEQIVFAGVGKSADDLRYAVEHRIGWINIENEAECQVINRLASERGQTARIALRYNPDVSANTISKIATGHSGAKFGLSADAIRSILERQAEFPTLRIQGIHIHIGSQLGDTLATLEAVRSTLTLIAPYHQIRTIDIGGGIPTQYRSEQALPNPAAFASALMPYLGSYDVLIEPGRSIIADAGLVVASVLYTKEHGGQKFVVLDTGMTELMRPALYDAHHEIVPLTRRAGEFETVDVVGPVCETTDSLAHARLLPALSPGDLVALLTAGAYGFVMASTYNARPRPPEVVVDLDGQTWRVARRRETWDDLIAHES